MGTLPLTWVADTELEATTVVEKSAKVMLRHCGRSTALKAAQTAADCSVA